MTGRIPEELVDTIRAQADIVDVVSDFVTLKKTGKNYSGLCPFHNEKTPSFSVNPERQIFHCFGCGKGGNVFTFLMEHEKMTFIEAVRNVAGRLNIVLPDTSRGQGESSEAESLARVTQFAARFFHEQLLSCPTDSPVREYVARRGLSDTTIHTFLIGYAPEGWDTLIHAARRQDIGADWLEKAGLAKAGNQRTYDAFRNRLMFPILGPGGRVVGFGGRALSDEDQPKYLNSPESPIYHKSREVYGLYQSREAIRRVGSVVIVEGYMDMLSLYQHGIDTAIATCGTALTRDHARLVGRYAREVTLVYDSDTAGTRAALRGIEPLVEAGLWTRILQLPAGEDPDTFVRKHSGEAFRKRLGHPDSIADFVADQFDLSQADVREEALKTLAGLINKTADLRHRERYIEESYARLPVPQSLLAPILRRPKTEHAQPPGSQKTRFEDPERELVRLMLQDVEIAFIAEELVHPDEFTGDAYRTIFQQRLDSLKGDGASGPAALIDQARDEETARIISELTASEDTGADPESRARDYIARIKRDRLKREMAELMKKIHLAQETGDDSLGETLAALQQLKREEQALRRTAE
ncbi:MAG: DNA primase [candidate division Zixibacteria bacterium]|nr:DNA primase [candidate division Zixibacteria bacterium]